VPPLALLFGICVFSIPQIRRKFYESFYILHILLSIPVLGLLFWHAQDQIDSWAYLWATLAIWLASWFSRIFWFNRSTNIFNTWLQGCPATVYMTTPDTVRVEVSEPANFKYCPGQHCFLRFHHLSPLDNHPFTLASATSHTPQSPQKQQKLLFIAKVHDGFTRKLASYCSAGTGKRETTVCIDGPYGGMSRPQVEMRYNSLLLIAGGSGISYCLSWLTYATSLAKSERLESVHLVWAVRDGRSFSSVIEELREAISASSAVQVRVSLHVTGLNQNAALEGTTSEKPIKKDGDYQVDAIGTFNLSDIDDIGTVAAGRPSLKTVVEASITPGKKLLVVACGPESMNSEAANVCADAQKNVLQGKALEVGLHMECFGW
jgi:predicted ferric reductase